MRAAFNSTKVPLVGVVEDDETGERPHQPTRGRDGHGCDPAFDECAAAAAAAPVGFALRGFLDVTVLSSPLVAARFEAPLGSAHRARLDRDHAHAAAADARALAAEKAEQERRRALLSAQQRRDDEQRARDAAAERALADALEAAQAAAQAKLEAAAQASAAAEQSKAFNRTQWDTWRLEGRAFDFDVEVGFEIGVSRERTRALLAYKRPL
jgi:selenocysteine-specific translation elongation factor